MKAVKKKKKKTAKEKAKKKKPHFVLINTDTLEVSLFGALSYLEKQFPDEIDLDYNRLRYLHAVNKKATGNGYPIESGRFRIECLHLIKYTDFKAE
jgi:hypothetical protein